MYLVLKDAINIEATLWPSATIQFSMHYLWEEFCCPAQTKLLNRSTKHVRISKSEQKRQTKKLGDK